MIRKLQCEKSAASEFQHLRGLGKNAEDRCAVRPSDFVQEASRDHARQHFVEYHDELTDLELPSDFHGDGRSLKVLSIGPKQDHKHIGDGDTEESFFVQTRVSVDEEIVEQELVDEILETVVHEADVVPFTKNLGDLGSMEAGRHQPDMSLGLLDPIGGYLCGGLSDPAAFPQVVIERAKLTGVLESE